MSTVVVATVKSNSSSPPAFQNTSGTEIGTLCRAWVNFNGIGTVAIRSQFNVSSITDLGVGNFRVNLITAMPDANYAAVATSATSANVTTTRLDLGYTSSVAEFLCNNGSTSATVDPSTMNVAIFR